eukprot:11184920-Lingulodinium_polyedra.AAC.1
MPESTPSFGGSSGGPSIRAAPVEATDGDSPVPATTTEQSGSDRDAAGRVAFAAMLAARSSARPRARAASSPRLRKQA